MKPIKRVLERLEAIEQRNGGFMALCPSHDDHTPSLSVSEGVGGKVLVRCFAGCETGNVLDALGLSMHDHFERGERNNGRHNGSRKPCAIWQVKDTAGEVQALHAPGARYKVITVSGGSAVPETVAALFGGASSHRTTSRMGGGY
jgi:hypothetical protein